jgi:hypothetical protein
MEESMHRKRARPGTEYSEVEIFAWVILSIFVAYKICVSKYIAMHKMSHL